MCGAKRVERKVVIGGGCGGDLGEISAQLKALGIDLEQCCAEAGLEKGRIKVVCVSPDLKDSVAEMGKAPRDQVLMVRVDEDTSRSLDAWVESGAVKSRSEAAALFIREGLKVRSSELERLREALEEVEAARSRLREKAREVFGEPEARAEGEDGEKGE